MPSVLVGSSAIPASPGLQNLLRSVTWGDGCFVAPSTLQGGRASSRSYGSRRTSLQRSETLAKIDEVDVEIPNPMTEDGLRRL